MVFEKISDDELPDGFMPPGAADNMMRQTMQLCWMDLPIGNRSIDALEAEMKRLLDRAFANLREDEKRKEG